MRQEYRQEKVFWSREEKRRWYESQTVEKEIIKSNTAIIHLPYMDKRKRRKARAQQSLPCAGISVEQITQAMATFTEAVFTAAGNMCNALAQAFSRQAQAFNAVADQYKDDKDRGNTWGITKRYRGSSTTEQ